ncbi:hypothetical protein [Desulfosarcina variabilis]|uniref:hypothetical protein n=1 Tax=Desulfosarcina variabilis TaxID=2300 RepID=UPI003AFAB794
MDKDEAHSTTGGFTGKAAWIPCRGLSCFPYQPFKKNLFQLITYFLLCIKRVIGFEKIG